MPQVNNLDDETQMALRRVGYPAPGEPTQWDPKVFGLPTYARLQVPLSTARTADVLRVLEDLTA